MQEVSRQGGSKEGWRVSGLNREMMMVDDGGDGDDGDDVDDCDDDNDGDKRDDDDDAADADPDGV